MAQFFEKIKKFCCLRPNQNQDKQHQNTQPLVKQKVKLLQQAHKLLDKVEIDLLTLIYNDLSVRSLRHTLNLQNFILLVRLQGSWGRCLFEQFTKKQINDDYDEISLQHFLYGMAKVHKGTKQQKIKLLFKIFAQNEDSQQGISFKQFIAMLCNYPKQQLKTILQDKQFITSQIKHSFIKISPLQIQLQNRNKSIDQEESQLSREIGYIYKNDYWATHSLSKSKSDEKKQENQITEYLTGDRAQTHFFFQFENKKYDIHLNSIHMLVKKFASKVFKQFKINRSSGRISLDQFIQWSQKHPKLYQNFYQGLHNQIWGLYEDETGKYGRYVKQAVQLQDQSKTVTRQPGQQGLVQKVGLSLVNQFIIIHQRGNKKKYFKIIYLYGMAVEKIYDNKHGHGIEIKAVNAIYPQTCFFFKEIKIQEKWLHALRFYKGDTIQDSFWFRQIKGKGAFSLFYRGEQKKTNKSVGIKKIQLSKLSSDQLKTIAQILVNDSHQSVIISILDHPFLMKFYGRYQTKTQLYLVTEFIDGVNLLEYFQNKGKKLSQFQTAIIVKQIMIGLRYLHDLGIVHRDIKLQNIMVESPESHYDDQGVLENPVKIKIIDFGFADYLKQLQRKDPAKLCCGSPGYIAPQILQMQGINIKSDNFAVGTIMYTLLSGQFPFDGACQTEVLIKNKKAHFSLGSRQWRKKSEEAKDLITKLFQKDHDKRISLTDAIEHKWFQKATENRNLNPRSKMKKLSKQMIVY